MTIEEIYEKFHAEILELDPYFEFPKQIVLDGREYSTKQIHIMTEMSYDYLTAKMICRVLDIETNITGDLGTVTIDIKMPKKVAAILDKEMLTDVLTSPNIHPVTDIVSVHIDEI